MSDFRFEAWPTEFRQVSQYFGANPNAYAQFGIPGHDGVDIVAPSGSKVFCVASGRVSMVHKSATGHNYGIHVRVVHQDGYQTIYGHLQEAAVEEGQEVKGGDMLGLADNTGNSFGAHLHLGLKKEGARIGNWPRDIIDPMPFLLPLLSWQEPAGPFIEGWVLSTTIFVSGNLAQANAGGASLRSGPNQSILIPSGTIMFVLASSRDGYTPVKVAQAAVDTAVPAPAAGVLGTAPAAGEATSDGWALSRHLVANGSTGGPGSETETSQAGPHGIEVRLAPYRNSPLTGLVKSGSTVSRLGRKRDDFELIRARRADFVPTVTVSAIRRSNAQNPPQTPVIIPPGDAFLGWVSQQNLSLNDTYAIVQRTGSGIFSRPSASTAEIGLVRGFATVTIAGLKRDDYLPVLVRREDVLNVTRPAPVVEQPELIPGGRIPAPPRPPTIKDTTPGWVLTGSITLAAGHVTAGVFGLNLRSAPRRDALAVGFVPAGAALVVTGPAQGEYTPVRVTDEELKQAPVGAPDAGEPSILGRVRIGLQASTDPAITEAEHQEFAALRPDIIKVLSFHDGPNIARLAAAHPDASWIVRAFLDFGGRKISPEQFVADTVNDLKRALDQLKGRDVVVELHNEPNLVAQGLGGSWSDGATFNAWWLDLLAKYRHSLPGIRFIYPGLSPGSTVIGVKQDHIAFIEASRAAVLAADGLGIHLFWSNFYPMRQALLVLDDTISRFRSKPIWVTEASNNKDGTPVDEKARQYLQLWHELQTRPTVRGVTFFVASSSNPAVADQVWVGRNIGAIVGRR